MAQIEVLEIASPGCHICMEFEAFWNSIASEWPAVSYKKIMVTEPEGQELVQKYMIFASPGIIVNGVLFSTGGFNKEQFIAKLRELQTK